MNKFSKVLLAGTMALGLGACSSKPAASTGGSATTTGGAYADKKVGIAIYQFNDNFMTLFRTELEDYLVSKGFDKNNITITILFIIIKLIFDFFISRFSHVIVIIYHHLMCTVVF